MPSYVITGASRGIGVGWVRKLSVDANNKVFALVRNPETATQLQEFMKSDENKNKNVIVIKADLTDYKTLKAAAGDVSKATGGTLDYLINNGALLWHERAELTVDALYFKTNVIGVTHTINAFIPLLRAGKTKKVLVVSSGMGSIRFNLDTNSDTNVAYSISKAAVNMVVVKFATRYKQEGFTIVAVTPGFVNTIPGSDADEVEKIREGIVARIRTVNPKFSGAATVEQAVNGQLALLERITPADTGAFIRPDGSDANVLKY
ncbi:short-chain dehydrogenases/reductase [Fomitiporia mediterranea MF3/22]|uniref:short-chain dehydrogenases/reductase n=1 Tax=Fomitiporia mediterranea (strain MF3/22) TaxID=694068 RepID=UPI0004407B7A|nr:short-chain dehydrogenases/reductase [Fomitiporia mediterranea MF3/22]EJD04817.1 short-chain dehydrogenases/reductase [Fomitiporia mediterranea MF3/22]